MAPVRPVVVWGPPGTGKSSIVQQFAADVGLPCVALLGSQLAPEDLIGVPQVVDGTSRFCPLRMIARAEPYCLVLDELNACSHEVQKAFYSLIHERRIGEYHLPPGSIVIGAGNRAQDGAIVRPMSSALMYRMLHVQLAVSHRDWLAWAGANGVHPLVLEYIGLRPDHLWSEPPKHEEPFSTPRSWHMLSDALHEYGEGIGDEWLSVLAAGCLPPSHATQFRAFVKQVRSGHRLAAIWKGEAGWPSRPEERDVLYFLSQSFRARLVKELPAERAAVTDVVNVAGGMPSDGGGGRLPPAQAARSWFISSYPLPGALASAFSLVEDPNVCARLGISIAAVDAESREIFVNPAAGLDGQEMRFVLAHELLHVGLRHEPRRQGRDPELWNVAAD